MICALGYAGWAALVIYLCSVPTQCFQVNADPRLELPPGSHRRTEEEARQFAHLRRTAPLSWPGRPRGCHPPMYPHAPEGSHVRRTHMLHVFTS